MLGSNPVFLEERDAPQKCLVRSQDIILRQSASLDDLFLVLEQFDENKLAYEKAMLGSQESLGKITFPAQQRRKKDVGINDDGTVHGRHLCLYKQVLNVLPHCAINLFRQSIRLGFRKLTSFSD